MAQEKLNNRAFGLGRPVLVAGSTHPGEEEIILSAYKKLLPKAPKLRLLIAPRHPQIGEALKKYRHAQTQAGIAAGDPRKGSEK